jgi:hypothetical protein
MGEKQDGTMTPSVAAFVVATVIVAVVGVGVAQAAVSADLEARYDATGSTDRPGQEIFVTGELAVEGESAVEPRIIVRPSPNTVLDADTVEVFVQGGQTASFEYTTDGDAVVATTEEIPSGTAVRVEFAVYPVATPNASSFDAGTVEVRFNAPGGDRQIREFPVSTNATSPLYDSLESRNQRIDEQEDTIQSLESEVSRLGIWRIVGIVGVAIGILGALSAVVISRRSKPPV